MASCFSRCLSCGFSIGEERKVLPSPDGDWMKYYRALYLSADGAKLSEICFSQFVWTEEEIWGPIEGNPQSPEEMLGPWYAMANSKPSKAHLFHESCWTLLCRFFEHDLDLDKLFEICKDIYSLARSVHLLLKITASEHHTFPLKRPEIQGRLAKNRRRFPRILKKSKGNRHLALNTDCFRLLPLEIRTEIATNLSTSEFLTLRLSSRSMGEVFSDRIFWKSRFIPSGDRGFLTSLLEAPSIGNENDNNQGPDDRDWRSIYRCTAKIGLKDGHLFEFRRQWQNNRWLRERYIMTNAIEKVGSYNNLLSEMSWKSLSTRPYCDRVGRQGTRVDLCNHCGMEHIPLKQAVPLSDAVVSIEVYLLREGSEEGTQIFITGLGLIERGTGNRRLIFGYRIPGQYVVIDLDGKRLMGLNAVAGGSGIRTIQPIFEDGLGRWAGDLDMYNTMRKELTTDTGVKAFSGHFDYCKMTQISIA